jgi:hypothetical protein
VVLGAHQNYHRAAIRSLKTVYLARLVWEEWIILEESTPETASKSWWMLISHIWNSSMFPQCLILVALRLIHNQIFWPFAWWTALLTKLSNNNSYRNLEEKKHKK